MKKTLQSVARLARKENLNYKMVTMNTGIQVIDIDFCNKEEFILYSGMIRKRKNIHVESNYRLQFLRVFDLDEYWEHKENDKRISFLSDLFFLEMRIGKTQDEAKETQKAYCIEHPEYNTAYNAIYY